MKMTCPACGLVLAKTDRRRKVGRQLVLLPIIGMTLEHHPNEAPRLKCPCGRVVILVEGKP